MRTRRQRVMAVGGVVGAFLLGGVTYGAVQLAGATAPGTTFYACLKAGKLTNVGATAPTCTGSATPVSWDSAGPQGVPGDQGPKGDPGAQGPVGPQGVGDAQYEAQNAWAQTVYVSANSLVAIPGVPSGYTLTIRDVSTSSGTPNNAFCNVIGSLKGSSVSYGWVEYGITSSPRDPLVTPDWFVDSTGALSVACSNSNYTTAVSLSGYLTAT